MSDKTKLDFIKYSPKVVSPFKLIQSTKYFTKKTNHCLNKRIEILQKNTKKIQNQIIENMYNTSNKKDQQNNTKTQPHYIFKSRLFTKIAIGHVCT